MGGALNIDKSHLYGLEWMHLPGHAGVGGNERASQLGF